MNKLEQENNAALKSIAKSLETIADLMEMKHDRFITKDDEFD